MKFSEEMLLLAKERDMQPKEFITEITHIYATLCSMEFDYIDNNDRIEDTVEFPDHKIHITVKKTNI